MPWCERSALLVVDVCSGLAISTFDRVLHVAVGLLYFPFAFVQDTFVVKIGITSYITDRLFRLALQLIDFSGDLFFFHVCSLRKLDSPALEQLRGVFSKQSCFPFLVSDPMLTCRSWRWATDNICCRSKWKLGRRLAKMWFKPSR